MVNGNAIELHEVLADQKMDYGSMENENPEKKEKSTQFPPISAMSECLLVISPFRCPLTWSFINLLCLIWSCTLLLQFRTGGEDPKETDSDNQLYMAWNFWTVTVWCLESGLCWFYHHYNKHSMRRLDHLMDLLQFIASVYFLVGSIQLYQQSRRPGEMINGEVTDVAISFVAYLGALAYYMSLYLVSRENDNELKLPTFCEREVGCGAKNQDDKKSHHFIRMA